MGLADVTDEENLANIRNALKRQVPGHLLSIPGVPPAGRHRLPEAEFQAQGHDDAPLSQRKKPAEERKTAETRAMIETFNTAVDFVDFRTLEPIVAAVR